MHAILSGIFQPGFFGSAPVHNALITGAVVALMGCYHGYAASGGARGVGRAATHAVVSAAVLIFAADYLLTSLFTAR